MSLDRVKSLVLTAMTVIGVTLIIYGFLSLIYLATTVSQWITMILLTLACLLLAPWVVKLPSGASWRPGLPLSLIGMFFLPPFMSILVLLPGLTIITAHARAPWWKYFETFAHVSIGLFCGAEVYLHLQTLWPVTTEFSQTFAIACALLANFFVNRFISALIVAHREKRTLFVQLGMTIRELHWGYMNAYLIVFITALVDHADSALAIFLAALLQTGVYRTVSHYSKVEKLRESAMTDGLTMLENRTSWESFIHESEKKPNFGQVILIDLNNFKMINDRHGHLIGDEILRDLSYQFLLNLPKPSRIFRFGGDEFVVFSRDSALNIRQSIELAVKIMNAEWVTRDIQTSVSIGVATSKNVPIPLRELFRLADLQMYEEKRRQRSMINDPEAGITSTIRGLVIALEIRDRYTTGHSFQVAFYSLRLAQKMGLESKKLKVLFRTGVAHDIGKIGIPDSILNKPGKLTEDEIKLIQEHTLLGYKICLKLEFLQEELEVILHHHERWDGTGYPNRLKGSQIPLLARIAAVADIYDALTSSRSYRNAWSHEKAMAYIGENSGTIFDPLCVQYWIELNEKVPLLQEYPQWANEEQFPDLDLHTQSV